MNDTNVTNALWQLTNTLQSIDGCNEQHWTQDEIRILRNRLFCLDGQFCIIQSKKGDEDE